MDLDRLPESLDADELASRGAILEGSLATADLPRLRVLCLEDPTQRIVRLAHQPICYRLEFRRDDGQVPRLFVGVGAVAILRCQRCLEPFDYRIDTRSDFRIVRREESTQADSNATEALVCTAGRLAPAAIIEDELLLALPDIPRHEEDSATEGRICRPPRMSTSAGDFRAPDAARGPFAALASLKDQSEIAFDAKDSESDFESDSDAFS